MIYAVVQKIEKRGFARVIYLAVNILVPAQRQVDIQGRAEQTHKES